MSTIVFVQPPMPSREAYGNLAKAESRLPPNGLCCLAAVTRQEGYDTKIIDYITEGSDLENIIKKILSYNPKYVGLSVYTITVHNAAEIAKELKKRNKEIKILIGGGQVSMLPEETMLKYPQFDIGVIGEGEITIVKLLNALEKGKDLSKVPSLIFWKDKKLIKTKREKFIENLDALPMPAWDLLRPLDKYYTIAADSINRSPSVNLITSRGCPAQCYFCNRSMFGNMVRSYSPKRIIEMIKYLIKTYKIKEVYIQDDIFTSNKKNVMEFCSRLIEEKLDLTWACHGKVDWVDLEMLQAMKKAGCWQISYGIESGSQEVLDKINKGIKIEQTENALKWSKQAGLRVKGFFMAGSFGETKETIKQTLKFIKKEPIDDFHMTCFTPMPATVSWKIADKYGMVDRTWEKLDYTVMPSFVPKDLTRKDVINFHRKAYRTFYLRPKTIFYYLKKLNSLNQIKKILGSLYIFIKIQFKKV